ncbi:hypothetical protein GCM10011613_07660 [Cellvibrio zantedeschiae]|uniref:DUF4166 domain-containing protein n=1 Tax=Cellvibrio zantedeschiae TaxID=1237077 RepID=A0ABQ3ASW1_9GAMM|nr:DUF4166 domain-containing protein [Cellvibrio zantedeschiae]GGY66222.1 hypothetical protein GCM10011613_07660 [Cellvibrio zantedeschiae]
MDNVFAKIIGSDYALLSAPVREFHEVQNAVYEGFAVVKGSNNPISRIVRRIFSFPVPAKNTSVSILITRTPELDQWSRDFGGRKFSSSFSQNNVGKVLSESFGPFYFYFSLTVSDSRLNWNFERWSLGVLPLPKFLGPKIKSWEGEGENGGYRFFSEAHFPVLGQLIYYDGTVFKKTT